MAKKAVAPDLAIKFWLYISNNGDGSASGHIFKSEEEAQAFAGEGNGEEFTESEPVEVILRVDEQGNLLPPPMTAFNKQGFLIENYQIRGDKKVELTPELLKNPKSGKGKETVYTYQDPRDWCWDE